MALPKGNRIGCHTGYQHWVMHHDRRSWGCSCGCSLWNNVVYNVPQYNCNCSSGNWFSNILLGFGVGLAYKFTSCISDFWSNPSLSYSNKSALNDSDSFWQSKKKKGTNTEGCTDQDDKIIKDFKTALDDLKATDLNKAKEMYKQIKDLQKKPEDTEHEVQNKLAYAQLLDELNAKAKENNWTLDENAKPKVKPGQENATKPVVVDEANPIVATPIPADEPEPATDTLSSINSATTIDDLLKCEPKTDEEKAQFAKKYKELNPEPTADDLAKIKDDALRALVKKQYYDTNENYDGATELKDGDVDRASDNSNKTNDTLNINDKITSITKSDDGSHPKTITIHDIKDITYTYQETVDGEYLYKSGAGGQIYALQKTSDGKFKLKQYSWHFGYGTKDWSPQ